MMRLQMPHGAVVQATVQEQMLVHISLHMCAGADAAVQVPFVPLGTTDFQIACDRLD